LAKSDIEAWHKAGWKYPEAFCTTAADGVTRLYGLMYKPMNFDASRKYPLIEYVYPGPITFTTPKVFIPNDKNQALSELGFIVIVMDGRGTLGRGKIFQDFSYGNFGRYELQDHVAAIKQLTERYSFIDNRHVGIYGRSAGGYAAARGLLQYPDVYHVGVALCGHHDYRKYNWYWVEQYCGHPQDTKEATIDQANAALAKNLRGKLLLIHGAMDDNVFPDHTIQLADALIAEKKDVDICIVPRQQHEFEGKYDEFCTRKIWNYFVEHLLNI
jgi:dipeptidyl aminopeptidase/acylaminoacyl peptidase